MISASTRISVLGSLLAETGSGTQFIRGTHVKLRHPNCPFQAYSGALSVLLYALYAKCPDFLMLYMQRVLIFSAFFICKKCFYYLVLFMQRRTLAHGWPARRAPGSAGLVRE